MQSFNGQTVVVAGATGNVGPFVVRALLERGASVAAPSRSEEKIRGLREHLSQHLDETGSGRLHTLVGDLSDEREAAVVRQRISEEAGTPAAVRSPEQLWDVALRDAVAREGHMPSG